MKHFAFFIVALCVASVPPLAMAEKADRDKPTHIEADHLVHDDLKQVSIFTGRAVLTKGTLILRGERIEVREDADGYQSSVILPAAGKRAFFRQKREAANEFIEAEGQRIDYDGKRDIVIITDRAEVRRYRGAVLGDKMTGQRIVYENLTDVFSIDGQRPDAKPGTTSTGRVRATLVPKDKTDDKPSAVPTKPEPQKAGSRP